MRGNGNHLARVPAIEAAGRRLRKARLALKLAGTGRLDGERALAPFETWPAWAFYTPVAGYVIWRGLSRGGIALAAVANPAADADGVMNVSKSRLFGAMGPAGRRWLPPYLVLERRPGGSAAEAATEAVGRMEEAGLAFPLVAKPDRGGRGAGVRLVRGEPELRAWLGRFPAGCRFLLQGLVAFEHEAGAMYVRPPGESRGRVVALALKDSPTVVGDGVATLGELIDRHPRARHHGAFARGEHRGSLDRVPARGERLELIFARNHCKGAVFRDASDLVTPALERRIDEIARSIPRFHLGRLDLRFASLPALRRGEEFLIIEINGAVSEPIHAWDAGNTVGQAWRSYFDQIDRLYQIGAASRARGHRGPGLGALLRGWWRQRRVTRSYPR